MLGYKGCWGSSAFVSLGLSVRFRGGFVVLGHLGLSTLAQTGSVLWSLFRGILWRVLRGVPQCWFGCTSGHHFTVFGSLLKESVTSFVFETFAFNVLPLA
jgi:hypothetical protein